MWSDIGALNAPRHFIMGGLTTSELKRIINPGIGPDGDSYMVTRLTTRKWVGGGWQ